MFEDSDKMVDGPSCPSCGSIADAEDKFCDVCGASIFGGDKQGGLFHALRRNQVLKFGIGGVVVSVLAIVAVAAFSGLLSNDANSREVADRKESPDAPAAASVSQPQDASSQETANNSVTPDAPAVGPATSPMPCPTGTASTNNIQPQQLSLVASTPANYQYEDEDTVHSADPGGLDTEPSEPGPLDNLRLPEAPCVNNITDYENYREHVEWLQGAISRGLFNSPIW